MWSSATAYHFAQTLYQSMNIPIGVIVSSWGGTRVEGWTNKEILETYPDVDLDESLLITSSWVIYPIHVNCQLSGLEQMTLK